MHFAIAAAFVILGVIGMSALIAGKARIEKSRPLVPVHVVRTIKIRTMSQSIHIRGEGTVRPLQEIALSPQVGGKIVYVSPALVNGGAFSKGEVLLRIEPVDYRLTVTLAQAMVKDAESKLQLTRELAAASRKEWHIHNSNSSGMAIKPPPLVAKEPQLTAARARLEADRASLRKALLDLERAELKAPFDGRVSQENVDIGQYVSPGQSLATLFSTGTAEIAVPLDDADLFWIHVPGFTPGDGTGSGAVIRVRFAGRNLTWPGEVVRAEGKIDVRTRMVNVVIQVKKPYAGRPPLAAGLFVTVDIEGRTLPHAAVIPRTALREGNVVWVVEKDGRLRFRKVDVARVYREKVMLKSGLKNRERIVISSLRTVSDGTIVHIAPVEERDGS